MKKILAFFLSVLSAFGATCALGGCSAPATDKEEGFIEVEVDASLSDIENVVLAGDEISLPERMVFASTVLSDDKPYTVTLTATIEPIDATDQRVEWSVLWQDPESDFAVNNVKDYVSIDVDGSYGKTATVTCLKAFNGEEIVIRAKAYGTDIWSDCVCTFAGVPTSAQLYDPYSYALDKTLKPSSFGYLSCYDFPANDVIEWTFTLDNEFHYVSSEFYDDFEFELTENCTKVYIFYRICSSLGIVMSEEEFLVDLRELNLVSFEVDRKSLFMSTGCSVENYSETFTSINTNIHVKDFSRWDGVSSGFFQFQGTNGNGVDSRPVYFKITDYGN